MQNSRHRLEYLRGQMALLKDDLLTGDIRLKAYQERAYTLQKKIRQA